MLIFTSIPFSHRTHFIFYPIFWLFSFSIHLIFWSTLNLIYLVFKSSSFLVNLKTQSTLVCHLPNTTLYFNFPDTLLPLCPFSWSKLSCHTTKTSWNGTNRFHWNRSTHAWWHTQSTISLSPICRTKQTTHYRFDPDIYKGKDSLEPLLKDVRSSMKGAKFWNNRLVTRSNYSKQELICSFHVVTI